jgi:ATP-dependent exoDNAse (exonuclease V) beta subunit
MQLSAEQQAAVERSDQDVCCVAGPGSGKTAVLVERFAWLVEHGTDARAILAITFTDKAATEIKTRLVKRFRDKPDQRRAVEHAPVQTLHSFCSSVLREHALAAGLDPVFDVLDAREAATEQAAAMDAVLDRMARERQPEFEAFVEAWPAGDHSRALLGVYEDLRMGGGARAALAHLHEFDPQAALDRLSEAVAEMVEASPAGKTEPQRRRLSDALAWLAARGASPDIEWLNAWKPNKRGLADGHPFYDGADRIKAMMDEARAEVVGALYAPQRAFAAEALILFEEEYTRLKRRRAGLDFADLEQCALALLETNHEIQRATAERFEAILMDELQDTNPVQWKILDSVRRPGRFFAVGDINQSIYGFRHAVPEQFSAYQKAVETAGGAIDRLERNYRSRVEVLDAVTAVLVAQPREGVLPHRLLAGREFPDAGGPAVEIQVVEAGEGGEESAWIARRLRELHEEEGFRFSEMAVLARTNSMFDELEGALTSEGVPAVVQRGRNFFAEPEIVDLTNWLRVLDNPANEIALLSLLRSPYFRISDEELLRGRLAGQLVPPRAWERIERARALREEIPLDRVLARMMDENGVNASANTEKFLRLTRDLDAAAPGDLAAHITYIDDLRANAREPNAPLVEAADAVRLMSIHSAKGLEFPVVVLGYLQRGVSSDSAPVCWSPRLGLGMKWRPPGMDKSISDPVHATYHSERGAREEAESDRLLYVAMTRAEQRLILSWTDSKRKLSPWPGLIEAGLPIEAQRRVGRPEAAAAAEAARVAEAPRSEPGTASGEAPASVAVTALATFATCPRQYWLRHTLNWPVDAGEGGTGAVELGIETHELLSGRRTEASSEARALARAFEESELGARAKSGARLTHEEDFLVELDGTLLRGQIDLHWDEGGRTVLVDYKTDRSMDEPRRRSYQLQMRLYALAWARWSGRPAAEAWLFELRAGHAEQVELQPEAAREVLRAWRAAERSGDFPACAGEQCRRCAYAGPACPAGVGA